MNAKTRIATLALAAMLFGSNAWADRPQYDYAKVISAEPIINYVTVKTPVRECWEETRYYTVDRHAGDRRGSTLLGAVIGGVVAAIGNESANKRYGHDRERVAYPVERCATRYREHREERIDGYRVMYRYHGQKYLTEMPYDPGNRLRVRVDVRPAG